MIRDAPDDYLTPPEDEDPIATELIQRMWRILPSENYVESSFKSAMISEVIALRGQGLSLEQLQALAFAAAVPTMMEAKLILDQYEKITKEKAPELEAFLAKMRKRAPETNEEFKEQEP